MYDNTKPINAELVMDPSDVSLDVNMNYDIGKNIIILYDRCCLIKILCVKFLPIYISKCRHFNWHTCMFKTELFILLLDRPNFGIIFENVFSFTFFFLLDTFKQFIWMFSENPQNVLHVNAKFADESGLTAEVFRNMGSQRISDTLINLRLKTSRILHTSVHWNPDLLKTVKVCI